MSGLRSLHTMNLFSRFFQENQEKFLAFAYSYLRDKAEAEDVVMESMIALWENRDRWEENSNLHALLLTIIKNKALRLRAEETISSHNLRELDLRISTLKACEPDQIFNTEIQHIVNKTLQEMPEQSRKIFMLSRYQNLANKQIADSLDISLKTVEAQSAADSPAETERLSCYHTHNINILKNASTE